MLNESFLHFVWRYNLYTPDRLQTLSGDTVQVYSPGKYNEDAGPDFEEAKIRIGRTLWVGHVEMHLRTGDWYRHGHQSDKAYDNVILHVVWEGGGDEEKGTLPVLQLKDYVSPGLLHQYRFLQQNKNPVPCTALLHHVNDLVRHAWMSRLLAERWEMKLETWDIFLQQHKGDWRLLLYWRLAANFGFKVNEESFLALAQSLPLKVLALHHDSLLHIEALLMGQAGFLEGDFEDDYPLLLQEEYHFLRKKYHLQPLSAHRWKFLRMRPANFPTIRIAQFAALVHRSLHLFTRIVSSVSLEELNKLFAVNASAYWDDHVRFGEKQSHAEVKKLGAGSILNIMINTVAPIRFMYSRYTGLGNHATSSVELMEQLPPERNRILRLWESLGWSAGNAAQSQALIQLYNHYCSCKQCLKCSIGYHLLRP